MSSKNSGFGFGSKGGNVKIADPMVGTFGKLSLRQENGSTRMLDNQVLSVKGASSWTIGLQGVPGTEYPLKDRGTAWEFYADRKQLANSYTANVAAKASGSGGRVTRSSGAGGAASGKPRRLRSNRRRRSRRRSASRKRFNNL